ncbi:MAG: hypothetical protein IKR39_08060 [Lachnospiraceae bacterium]|nr:hypothetical protein [Lachnospiraceae bacterium]
MKITFDTPNLQKFQDAKRAYASDSSETIRGIGSSYDITASLTDSKTYGGEKMSVNELKNQLKARDVEVCQDYMTVMSNAMSKEDFGKLVAGGGTPGSVEIKDSVTIVDKIKLAVARSGQEIAGYTDTLDKETIKAMTGLESMEAAAGQADVTLSKDLCKDISVAVEEISEVTEMTEGMMKDFVSTGKPLTIDNLYLSKHTNCQDTREQGGKYFAIEAHGYLAEKGTPATEESLKSEVTDLLLSIDIEPTVENVEDGIWLVKNSLYVDKENLSRLQEVKSVSLPMSDEEISKVIAIAVSEGKEPKEALVTAKESIYEEAVRITDELEKVIDTPFIKAARVLEETRLKMTTEANLLLLKSGFHIDTKDMEAYVEALKKIEQTPEFKEAAEVVRVNDTVEAIKSMPVQFIAPVADRIGTVTLEEIHETAAPVKARLEAANIAYEQVGTEVRRDLGDSIKKAFRNIPEILESLGLEDTKENERGVRILGYNSMPITKESLETIKEADRKLQAVLTRLTPADTLKLIREEKSPIRMSVDELNEYLNKKETSESEEMEKYSKFLYKLERDKEITPEERADYIEVYRFIHKLEKTDYAAVGSVINAGGEMTLSNLKTAMKTAKHRGMDVTVGEVYDTLVNPAKDDPLEAEWISHKYAEMREALGAPEESVTELIMSAVPITIDNLEAALMLRAKRGEAFKKATDAKGGVAKEKALSLTDAFLGRDETIDAYEDMATACKSAVYEECMSKDSYLDVRALQLVHRQLNVARAYADAENYEVPMEIGGQVTSVNVKLVHNSSEEANVVVSMETDDLGRISARFSGTEKEISGYIACNFKETVNKMEKVADKLNSKVSVVLSKTSDTDTALSKIPMRDNTEEVSSKELYNIAKLFLDSLKGIMNEN